MTEFTKEIHCVMLVDAWFPHTSDGPGEYSGLQVHVHNLRRELTSKKNTSVELFYPSNPNALIRWSWVFLVIYQVIVFSKTHPINIIHSHGSLSAIPAKILSLLLRVPVVHTVHRATHLELDRRSPQAFLEWFSLTKIRFSRQISVAQSFTKRKNRNTDIAVIPNGIELERFDRIHVKKNTHPSLIWVGRDHPSKGLEYLRKAIKRVRTTFPELEAHLVTGGNLTGDDLIKAYKKAHLFVLPSLHETQPLTLLEAWASKLPVIVTDVGDNRHMVEDGVNGLVVEPANVKQLSDAILKLLRAKVTHHRLAEAGYEYVKLHYNWREVATKTRSIYKECINQYLRSYVSKPQVSQNSSMPGLRRSHQIPS